MQLKTVELQPTLLDSIIAPLTPEQRDQVYVDLGEYFTWGDAEYTLFPMREVVALLDQTFGHQYLLARGIDIDILEGRGGLVAVKG